MRARIISLYLNGFFFNSYYIFLHRSLTVFFFFTFIYEFINNIHDINLPLAVITGIIGLIPLININIFIQEYNNQRIQFEHYIIFNKNCGIANIIITYMSLCVFIILSYINYLYNKKMTGYIWVLFWFSMYCTYILFRSLFIVSLSLCVISENIADTENNHGVENIANTGNGNGVDIIEETDNRPLSINNYFDGIKIEEDSDNYCSICLENYKENEYISITECNHQFHKQCINRWISSQWSEERDFPQCPNCRNSLQKSEI